MSVPFFSGEHVRAALAPDEALEAVRAAFVEHAQGQLVHALEGLRARAAGRRFPRHARPGSRLHGAEVGDVLPGNPERGLPTVSGIVLLSDATTGELRALLDAAAVTALRTGAAAVLAAETLARPTVAPATVVGTGVNGRAVAQTFLARGREVSLWDARREAAEAAAEELGEGATVATDAAEALSADIVATVTPGFELLFDTGSLHAGQHVSLMGADGPGKAEIAVDELLRARVVCDEWEQSATDGILQPQPRLRLFCDEWDQASHAGDLARAVQAGGLGREDVIQLGDVLTGTSEGRRSEHDITVFDSTGLAIQDLAVAIAIYERWRVDPSAEAFAGVSQLELG